MLRWFPRFQVATTCFSCSPSGLKFMSNQFHILYTCKTTTATGWQPNCSYYYYYYYYCYTCYWNVLVAM